jgi:hypothetical protein
VLPAGIGVVLVFYTVVGRVSSVTYPVFVMLHFHRGTGFESAL